MNDQDANIDAVTNEGPLIALMYVMDDFMSYEGGVYSNPACISNAMEPSHVVQVIGYGTGTERKLLETPAALSIVTEPDLQRNNTIFLQNTLNQVPGVRMNVRSVASQSNLVIRGIGGTYGRFGIYSVVALVLNVLLILGVMSMLGATLTLPGIAGLVLTIGAAVDANVLINERIREEARKGRGIVPSIEVGYRDATRTIWDANSLNIIVAVIMFIFGSGPIKGFAVVLSIGIATSVFTAVTVTRLMVARWLSRGRPAALVI